MSAAKPTILPVFQPPRLRRCRPQTLPAFRTGEVRSVSLGSAAPLGDRWVCGRCVRRCHLPVQQARCRNPDKEGWGGAVPRLRRSVPGDGRVGRRYEGAATRFQASGLAAYIAQSDRLMMLSWPPPCAPSTKVCICPPPDAAPEDVRGVSCGLSQSLTAPGYQALVTWPLSRWTSAGRRHAKAGPNIWARPPEIK